MNEFYINVIVIRKNVFQVWNIPHSVNFIWYLYTKFKNDVISSAENNIVF